MSNNKSEKIKIKNLKERKIKIFQEENFIESFQYYYPEIIGINYIIFYIENNGNSNCNQYFNYNKSYVLNDYFFYNVLKMYEELRCFLIKNNLKNNRLTGNKFLIYKDHISPVPVGLSNGEIIKKCSSFNGIENVDYMTLTPSFLNDELLKFYNEDLGEFNNIELAEDNKNFFIEEEIKKINIYNSEGITLSNYNFFL